MKKVIGIPMDYIVLPKKSERNDFYNYLVKKNFKAEDFTKEDFINKGYPFTINKRFKLFSLLNSVTCCALAQENKKIISVEEYIKQDKKANKNDKKIVI